MHTTHHQPATHRFLSVRAVSQPDSRPWRVGCIGTCLALAVVAGFPIPIRAADPVVGVINTQIAPVPMPLAGASAARSMGEQLREVVDGGALAHKKLTLVISSKDKGSPTRRTKEPVVPAEAAHNAHFAEAARRATSVINPQLSRQYIRARAAALTGHESPVAAAVTGANHLAGHNGDAHWAYEGVNGPQAWGKLNPEFNLCAIGKRQSPINIDESVTLQGPAEPLQFNYQTSSGSVVNNGHTIQVDLVGENSLTVRGSSYKLVQFHFHHPAEEQVNYRRFAMVAHLVHKNPEGQLAVVAVLLEPGVANALIDKVWTHMPLDVGDRVRLPAGLVNMNELLPKDQRYYQFMGSLTTPPCSEGVLWLVFKAPSTASQAQIRLFSQLFPNNARPVQPINGRPVRDAQ